MKVKILVIIMIVLAIFSIWYLTPKRYTMTLDGVYYQLGKKGVVEDVKLRLNGKLQNLINGKKAFRGVIEIKGNKIPHIPKDRGELILDYHGDNFSSIYSPFRVIDDVGRISPDIYNYGLVYINDDFTQFTIQVIANGDIPWTPTDGFMITAPAKDREEAFSKSQKLMKKLGIIINN